MVPSIPLQPRLDPELEEVRKPVGILLLDEPPLIPRLRVQVQLEQRSAGHDQVVVRRPLKLRLDSQDLSIHLVKVAVAGPRRLVPEAEETVAVRPLVACPGLAPEGTEGEVRSELEKRGGRSRSRYRR